MVFDSGGVLREDGRRELARVEEPQGDVFARMTVASDTYEIAKEHGLGWHFKLLDSASAVIYDFHPGLRRGGTLMLQGGEPAAEIVKHWTGHGWTIAPNGREPIEVRRKEGWSGPTLTNEGLTAPDLELSSVEALDAPLDPRLLAFACWLIAQWESEVLGL